MEMDGSRLQFIQLRWGGESLNEKNLTEIERDENWGSVYIWKRWRSMVILKIGNIVTVCLSLSLDCQNFIIYPFFYCLPIISTRHLETIIKDLVFCSAYKRRQRNGFVTLQG